MTIFAGPATISVAEITIITILAGNISAVITHAFWAPGTEDGLDEGRVTQLSRETAEVVLIVGEGANPGRSW